MDLIEKYLGEVNPAGVDVQKALMRKHGVDWKDFYKMSKDTTGKTFKEYEKKYGKMYIAPHIKDALDKSKNFKDFERMIKKFNEAKKKPIKKSKCCGGKVVFNNATGDNVCSVCRNPVGKGDTYMSEAMGFVQKLPYQEKKSSGGKKSLSAADRALLKSRGGSGSFTTKRGKEVNLSKTPTRPDSNKKGSNMKQALDAPVKVGDIFYNSWGYDQTNIDWYQVVSVSPTGKSVKIRPIKAKIKETGFMSGESMPVKNKFDGPAKTKRIRVNGNQVNLPMDYGWCGLWDGRPKSASWYA